MKLTTWSIESIHATCNSFISLWSNYFLFWTVLRHLNCKNRPTASQLASHYMLTILNHSQPSVFVWTLAHCPNLSLNQNGMGSYQSSWPMCSISTQTLGPPNYWKNLEMKELNMMWVSACCSASSLDINITLFNVRWGIIVMVSWRLMRPWCPNSWCLLEKIQITKVANCFTLRFNFVWMRNIMTFWQRACIWWAKTPLQRATNCANPCVIRAVYSAKICLIFSQVVEYFELRFIHSHSNDAANTALPCGCPYFPCLFETWTLISVLYSSLL